MKNDTKLLFFGSVCLWLFFAAGCVETAKMFHGNQVASGMEAIVLQDGGPHVSAWSTFDLKIDYEYTQNNNLFDISARAELSAHYQGTYASLNRLAIYLFFVDANARVLKTVLLDRAVTGALTEQLRTTQQLELPDDAVAISYGYDGLALDRHVESSFYLLPLK